VASYAFRHAPLTTRHELEETMHIRKPLGERIFDWINILLLCLLVIVTLYPLLYVLFASISEPNQLVKSGHSLGAVGL